MWVLHLTPSNLLTRVIIVLTFLCLWNARGHLAQPQTKAAPSLSLQRHERSRLISLPVCCPLDERKSIGIQTSSQRESAPVVGPTSRESQQQVAPVWQSLPAAAFHFSNPPLLLICSVGSSSIMGKTALVAALVAALAALAAGSPSASSSSADCCSTCIGQSGFSYTYDPAVYTQCSAVSGVCCFNCDKLGAPEFGSAVTYAEDGTTAVASTGAYITFTWANAVNVTYVTLKSGQKKTVTPSYTDAQVAQDDGTFKFCPSSAGTVYFRAWGSDPCTLASVEQNVTVRSFVRVCSSRKH